ncbi:tyrosine-type recombinase/integrase [Nitrogeniibacter aestuarii]|uniref:tyrosine-type recombinase/integrase n=1 Tax=Nitrogeniibacter aestuarii TaxID=2815343 RepID=UPI001D106DC5|nr:site-specific integrase [Nitrogeniibacter aestuarii]
MKAYKEGKGWCIRVRAAGVNRYLSGYPSAAAAEKAARDVLCAAENIGKPFGRGPEHTTVAAAMGMYGVERLPYLKGARQDAQRMNEYLRLASLECLVLVRKNSSNVEGKGRSQYFDVTKRPFDEKAPVVASLRAHRALQAASRPETLEQRTKIANMRFADVTRNHIQELVDAMQKDGFSRASIDLELAQIKRVFRWGLSHWNWHLPVRQPVWMLAFENEKNERERILTRSEWVRLCKAIDEYKPNPYFPAAVALLLETAMRTSEPLMHATWEDVDWEHSVLQLKRAKRGSRKVPLSPEALSILKHLKSVATDERILPMTYEALKAGWNRVRARAGVDDVQLHDLRHTAATRYAIEFSHDRHTLKVITGHRSDRQLDRYVNIKPEDVAAKMRKDGSRCDFSPAKLADALPSCLQPVLRAPDEAVSVREARRSTSCS